MNCPRAASAAAFLLLCSPLQAAITGQWDFNSDLGATVGQPIFSFDAATQAGTQFGTTTTFGIPNIAGQPAEVMRFPKTGNSGGYGVPIGAAANGGGNFVNQYTIIMDVLFPQESAGRRRALVDKNGDGATQFAIQSTDGIGTGTVSHGNVTPGQWHRLVFAVDLSVSPSVVDKYIDGVKVGSERLGVRDSEFSLVDAFFLFSDDNDETEIGYINSLQFRDEKMSDGLIAALGGPSASGILTGPPPNPYITSISPSPDTARIPSRSTVPPNPEIQVTIENGVTSPAAGTFVMRFDNEAVVPEVTTSGTTTTVRYTPTRLLDPLSLHTVSLTFNDTSNPPATLGTTWEFAVGPFTPVEGNVALPLNTAGPRGFTARTAQGPLYVGVVNHPDNLAATVQRGIQQLNGTLRARDGSLVQNEADPGPEPGGFFYIEGGLNFSTQGEPGYFTGDLQFPGVPGETGHTTQFTTEFLGFLELPAGVHKFGVGVSAARVDVNDDDNFAVFVGLNPRDAFSQVLGSYVRNDAPAFEENSQNHNEFTFFAPTAGLYPIRIVYVQSGRIGSLEFYSISDGGERVLINDLANPNAVRVYRDSTSSRALPPYVAEVSPRPGTSGNDPSRPVVILLDDGKTPVAPGSVQLTFNGAAVNPTIEQTGARRTITYQPSPTRTQTENNLALTYADTATPQNAISRQWSFTTTAGAGGPSTIVRGQWDFNGGNLSATIGRALEYFDGPGGVTAAGTRFGSTASLGIAGINGEPALVMEVPGEDTALIGYKMFHGITPNGGGNLVNQYTLIMDVMLDAQNVGAEAASLIQIDSTANSGDGDLFWQGNNFGQGQGGYVGNGMFTLGAWHRVAVAVDLTTSPGTIAKFVDGVKQHEWRTDAVDGRRALRDFAILFADGDADERRRLWVNSIQIREGKLTDAQLVLLGGPSAAGIPTVIPETNVAGQWDFDRGNLEATAGRALEFFDGIGGVTQAGTRFGTTTALGIPNIAGQPALVMEVPGEDTALIGYKMFHGIPANGGGNLVNQYTLIMDVLMDTQNTGAEAASLVQIDSTANSGDGDLFWQGNNFGQGQGGYVGNGMFTLGAWHRVAIAVDLTTSPGTIAKFVDGVKQHDWRTDSVDGRRALRDFAILFADGDADERRRIWVNSVQVRAGKLSDAQLVLLGGPSAGGIPIATPQTTVAAQWDFDRGNLEATAGRALEFFDGVGGTTQAGTRFGTTTALGIPDIAGQPAAVMEAPGDDTALIGYKMFHGIPANGGGNLVNQYTLIMDVMLDTANTGAEAASLIQIDSTANSGDGDVFWQGNNFGQGQGGYVGTGIFTLGAWHRVAFAVDLTTAPGTITKFVDGVKQHDWRTDAVDGRRALREFAILFADGDADERRRLWVNSVQIHPRKLSDAELMALGGPSAAGIPMVIPGVEEDPEIEFTVNGSSLQLSWSGTGFVLQSTTDLNNPNWVAAPEALGNSASIPLSPTGNRFFRLRK